MNNTDQLLITLTPSLEFEYKGKLFDLTMLADQLGLQDDLEYIAASNPFITGRARLQAREQLCQRHFSQEFVDIMDAHVEDSQCAGLNCL